MASHVTIFSDEEQVSGLQIVGDRWRSLPSNTRVVQTAWLGGPAVRTFRVVRRGGKIRRVDKKEVLEFS